MTRFTGQRGPASRGFTIIELMVVVAMIAMLIGFSVPLVFKIDELSRDRSGVNTFGVAVTAARAYATRRIADDDEQENASYSGTAIVVTPYGELRLVENDQRSGLEPRNGYKDLSRTEFISLPKGISAVGIARNGTGAGGLLLLPPPFAIRFNERGHLISDANTADAASENTVIYDFGGGYQTSTRPGGYDLIQYDPDHTDVQRDPATGKYIQTAFGNLETVVGVIVYSKADFEDAGGQWKGTGSVAPEFGCKTPDGSCGTGMTGVRRWMLDNGTVLFFSRFTGQIIRQNAP